MNRIEKGKVGLKALSIVLMLLAIGAVIGAIFLIIFGAGLCSKGELNILYGVLAILGGGLIVIGGFVFFVWAFWFFVLGCSVKAKGSVAEDNLAKQPGNLKRCPKCGAANTVDSTVCGVCKTPLE